MISSLAATAVKSSLSSNFRLFDDEFDWICEKCGKKIKVASSLWNPETASTKRQC
jgi:hypothetical protein